MYCQSGRGIPGTRNSADYRAILLCPELEKRFVVTPDASDNAIGAILSQGEVGQDLPVCYARYTLNKIEWNYSTREKELHAIVWSTT